MNDGPDDRRPDVPDPAATRPPPSQPRPRRRPGGEPDVRRIGVPRDGWRDAYYYVLLQPWAVFYLVLVGAYLTINSGFATLYWLRPGCVGEEHPGLWLEDFFFSLETLATVGYGVMHPITRYAHWVVAAEIMVGVLLVPLLTGLTIVKFARAVARVLFSNNVLVTTYDGAPTLLFRLANIRSNQIFEAHINVTLLRAETTNEGRVIRRLVDVPLVRNTNPMFVLTWTVMHRIDEASPLYDVDLTAVPPGDIEILAVMTGLDATASATVHARHVYGMDDVLIDHMFEDIVVSDAHGRFSIDYRLLHAVRRVAAASLV